MNLTKTWRNFDKDSGTQSYELNSEGLCQDAKFYKGANMGGLVLVCEQKITWIISDNFTEIAKNYWICVQI